MRSLHRSLILAALLAPTSLWADDPRVGPAEQALRAACVGDYRRLCTRTGSNAAAIEACFREASGQVSPSCQAAISEFGLGARAERAAR
ncbi:hypothetical protein [Methylobacterium crusticola]|nr:hypothetical protein [Methylobacterium crusticola]